MSKDTVKLFNQGTREIHGMSVQVGDDGAEVKVPYVLKPKKSMAFTADEAAKIKRLFANEVISMDDVKHQFDQEQVIPLSKAEEEKKAAIAAAVAAALEEERKKVADERAQEDVIRAAAAAADAEAKKNGGNGKKKADDK